MVNTLHSQLTQLRLATIRISYKELALRAQKEQWSYEKYLESLCDQELLVDSSDA
jgi:hypothetical protein